VNTSQNFNFFSQNFLSESREISLSEFSISGYKLNIKREDEIHDIISGNKFRKLKYNIREAISLNKSMLVTFGGAYSNHIVAVAAAGTLSKLNTVGIIRGEELSEKIDYNPTLSYARKCEMTLRFVSRSDYRDRMNIDVQSRLLEGLEDFYLIPEGGTNALAVQGCEEILNTTDTEYDYICVSVGTGGTLAGILNSAQKHQKVIGFSALKGTFQTETIQQYSKRSNFEITDEFCFGGYAKIDSELVRFINMFKEKTGILLDPVYTGKMMYGIIVLMGRGYFRKNSRILAIHTGGLQGIEGMNQVLKKKNLPQINL